MSSLAVTLGLLATLPEAHAVGGFGTRAVATESPEATHEAMRVLRAGGNAVDAVVTAALVSGVASPSSSGIGGGGFALVWTAATAKMTVLDFRETAPNGIDVAAFEKRPFSPQARGRAVGVPGEIAGLAELQRRFGKKSWAEVVRPAVRVAKEGYVVSAHLASVLKALGSRLAVDDDLASLFAPGEKARLRGVRLRNVRLGETLQRLEAEGPRAIYEGNIAAELANRTTSAGGALTVQDLAAYRPVERDALLIKWEGYDVYTMSLPSAGGCALGEVLGSLNSRELRALGRTSGAYQHLLAEVLRGALTDRMRYLGDPAFEAVDVPKLLSPERLATRRHAISPERTQSIPIISSEEHGTHHMVTADADGNIVSLTTTVNSPLGAVLSAHDAGVILNNELDDFTTKAAVQDFGLGQSPNRPRPNARPISSMMPTIVFKKGAPILALGGSGGMTIVPNVIEVLLARLVFGETPLRAVSVPRFGIPLKGSTMAVAENTPTALRRDLEARGETLSLERSSTHAVQLIAIDHGRKIPAADPRKGGAALAE